MNNIEQIRKQKLGDVQRQQQSAEEQDFTQQQLEGAKKTILQRFLTKEARERLATVRIANPKLAEHIEVGLFEAAQSGQIQGQITEEQLKDILNRATGAKKDFRIIR